MGFVLRDASEVFSAYLSRPSHVPPSQILNWKTQRYAPDLPLASQESLGRYRIKIPKLLLLLTSPDTVGLWATSVPAPRPTCLSSARPACSCLRACALVAPSPWKALPSESCTAVSPLHLDVCTLSVPLGFPGSPV